MHLNLNCFSQFHRFNFNMTMVNKSIVLLPEVQKALITQNVLCIKCKTF